MLKCTVTAYDVCALGKFLSNLACRKFCLHVYVFHEGKWYRNRVIWTVIHERVQTSFQRDKDTLVTCMQYIFYKSYPLSAQQGITTERLLFHFIYHLNFWKRSVLEPFIIQSTQKLIPHHGQDWDTKSTKARGG